MTRQGRSWWEFVFFFFLSLEAGYCAGLCRRRYSKIIFTLLYLLSQSPKNVIYYINMRCTTYTRWCLHICLTFQVSRKTTRRGKKKKRVNVTTFIYKSRDLSALGSFVVIKAYRKTEKKEKETHTSLVRAQNPRLGGNFGFAKQRVEERRRSYTGFTQRDGSRTNGIGSHLGSSFKTNGLKKKIERNLHK